MSPRDSKRVVGVWRCAVGSMFSPVRRAIRRFIHLLVTRSEPGPARGGLSLDFHSRMSVAKVSRALGTIARPYFYGMTEATLRLSYGHLEVEAAADGGVSLTTYGPRGGYNAEFETPFPAQLIELLEHVAAASAEASRIDGIHTWPLPNSDRRLVARAGWRGNRSVQLHTSRGPSPSWHRDSVGAPLLELPLSDLQAVIAILRDLLPAPPALRLLS